MLTRPFIETLKEAIHTRANKPVERLRSILEIFSEWNKTPTKRHQVIEYGENLTPSDVSEIKELIWQEISKTNFKNKNEITEQLLFNIVGALKNSQKETLEDPWRIAKLNASFLLSNSSKKLSIFHLIYIALFVTAGSFVVYASQKGATSEDTYSKKLAVPDMQMTIPMASQNFYVPSHLYSLKAKMDKATCQFPQAPVLPPEQRAAFLDFVNKGEISLSELSHLQEALTHVNCQYTPLTADLSATKQ